MLLEKKPVNFEDERGSIRDILIGYDIDAITILSCKAGSVRGNHYHKVSAQYVYIISGRLLCAAQSGDADIEFIEASVGDLVFNPPGERHAFKALEDTCFLSLTKGPRRGKEFEDDTYRFEEKLLT